VSRAGTRARNLILSGSKPFSVTAIFATWTSTEPGLAEVAGAPTTKLTTIGSTPHFASLPATLDNDIG
jgi:hypothetical protein